MTKNLVPNPQQNTPEQDNRPMTIAEVIEALKTIEDKTQELYVSLPIDGSLDTITGISLYNTDESHTEDNPYSIDCTPIN